MADFAEFIETLGDVPAPPAKPSAEDSGLRTEFREVVEDARLMLLGDDLWMGFLGQFEGLDGDELDIVGLVIERLKLGRGIYGQWVASADLRDHDEETEAELIDGAIYQAMREIRRRRTR